MTYVGDVKCRDFSLINLLWNDKWVLNVAICYQIVEKILVLLTCVCFELAVLDNVWLQYLTYRSFSSDFSVCLKDNSSRFKRKKFPFKWTGDLF